MATENEKLRTELVVIGGGGAGLAAALAAAENGCRNIVVIEKAGQPSRLCTQLRPYRR
jgi:succinate dehydrogenase/fumarate reductase flavoprotein subunit